MVDPWWSLLGAAIPAVIIGQAMRMKKRRAEEQRQNRARGREKSSDDIFVCERVCTSKRMLKKVGALSKDPTTDTCVTVCGISELDACADACARTVCVNQHQVPNWNDICLKKCQSVSQNLKNYLALNIQPAGFVPLKQGNSSRKDLETKESIAPKGVVLPKPPKGVTLLVAETSQDGHLVSQQIGQGAKCSNLSSLLRKTL